MEKNKDFIDNGNVYNLDNIWEYMEKDYWDADDLKFDFWYRLQRHQRIFYKVMELNNIKLGYSKYKNAVDCTEEILKEMEEKRKKNKVKIIWEDWEDCHN